MSDSTANTIRCVLFDVGGVLVELSGVPTMLDWMGGRTDAEGLWREWLSSPSVRAYETGQVDTAEFAALVTAAFALRVDAQQFLEGFRQWPKGALPGAHELLREVHPRLIKATFSNSNALHWPRVMTEMGFEPLFDHHFASHVIGHIKPDASAFAHVATNIGLTPAEILFVDDNRINVHAAAAAGFNARQCVGPEAVRGVLAELGLLLL